MHRSIIVILIILGTVFGVSAQDDAPPPTPEATYFEPVTVETRAEDGLRLKADWFAVDPNGATVILVHELYKTRSSWRPLVGLLLGGGYNVLAIDVRGGGETRGATNWGKAADDMSAWFAWLRDEAGVRDAISTVGSSMGSSIAIVGCANDETCRTAIAISPGWSYFGLRIEDAIAEGLAERGALLLFAERDRWPALARPRIEEIMTDATRIFTVPGVQHGMRLLEQEHQTLVPLMFQWLAERSG